MSDNVYAPPQAAINDHAGDDAADVATRQAHLNHEAGLRAVGMLYYVGAAFMLIGSIGLIAGSLGDDGGAEGGMLLLGIAVVYLLLGLLAVWVGRGLRKLSPKIKIPATILAVIGLLGFPIGTLINAYVLYLLHSARGRMVLSTEYQGIVARTPHIRYRTPVWIWVVLAVLIGLVLLAVVLPAIVGAA